MGTEYPTLSHELKTALIATPAILITVIGYLAYFGAKKVSESLINLNNVSQKGGIPIPNEQATLVADGGYPPGSSRQKGEF